MTETQQQRMAELARRAANIIDENGLFQGDFYDPWAKDSDRCAVCAVGALRLVLANRPDAEPDDTELLTTTVDSFATFLGVPSIPDWNDEPGRTAEEVVAAYRRFGASLLAA